MFLTCAQTLLGPAFLTSCSPLVMRDSPVYPVLWSVQHHGQGSGPGPILSSSLHSNHLISVRVLVSTWAGRTQVSPPSGQISGCHWEFTWCSSGSWILEKDVGGPAALEFTLRGGEGERLLFRWALAEMGSGNAGEALGTGPGLEWIASTFSFLCSPPSLCRFCRTFPWIHSLSLHKSHLCFQWLSEHVYSIHSYLKSIPFVSEYIQDEDFWVILMSLWFEEYKKKIFRFPLGCSGFWYWPITFYSDR